MDTKSKLRDLIIKGVPRQIIKRLGYEIKDIDQVELEFFNQNQNAQQISIRPVATNRKNKGKGSGH